MLAQVQADTTAQRNLIEDGHRAIGDQINLMTILITAIVVVGFVLLLNYAASERRKRKKNE